MSRYQMDKLMRQVVLNPESCQSYKQEPSAFLNNFELTESERAALLEMDYKTLYVLGAHPFLLNGFVMRVWSGDRTELRAKYNKSLANLGHPDFST